MYTDIQNTTNIWKKIIPNKKDLDSPEFIRAIRQKYARTETYWLGS